MLPNMIKVGTISPCYNSGRYFPDCLYGIVSQSRKPDYAVVVDDGSTDSSWHNIIDSFDYPRLNYNSSFHEFNYEGINFTLFQLEKNQGVSFARNLAMKYLLDKCHIAAIADCDDIYYPDKIKKSLEVMMKYPEVALVYSDYVVQDMSSNSIRREYKEPFSLKRLLEECIVSNNSIFALSIIKQIGGYNEKLRCGEDYDFWLRIAEIASVYHIPESLYCYRVTGNNTTIKTDPREFAAQVQWVQQMAQIRQRQRMGVK